MEQTVRSKYLDKKCIHQSLLSVAGGRYISLAKIAADRAMMLNNLLSTIHRDGGHYIDSVGYEQASKDAESIVIETLSALDSISILIDRVESLLDDEINPYHAINKIKTEIARVKQPKHCRSLDDK